MRLRHVTYAEVRQRWNEIPFFGVNLSNRTTEPLNDNNQEFDKSNLDMYDYIATPKIKSNEL